MPEYRTLSELVVHPLNGVVTVPVVLALFQHEPVNDAAAGTNPGASSQPIVTIGHVTTAGPAPVTLTVQV